MDVPTLLREARARAQLSQTALARRSGVARTSISAWENDRHSPSVAQLKELVAVCGLQLDVQLVPRTDTVEAQVERLRERTPEVDGMLVCSAARSFQRTGCGGRSTGRPRSPCTGWHS